MPQATRNKRLSPRKTHTVAVLMLMVLLSATAVIGLGKPLHAQDVATYTVAAGDTLSGIAFRFEVPLESLITLNNIEDPALIQIGQVLYLPGADSSTRTAIATTPVSAYPGETLSGFAVRTEQDPAFLAALNGISETLRLFPGQPIAIPSDRVPSPALRFGAITDVNHPARLIQGKTGQLVVASRHPIEIEASWNGLAVSFSRDPTDPLRQFALLPVPALIEPGSYPLAISYTTGGGLVVERVWTVEVVEGEYASQEIVVSTEKAGLLDPSLVTAELAQLSVLWNQRSLPLQWNNLFWRPIAAEYATTSLFGTRRSYQGGPVVSYHSGQDFGAPEGVPVVAPADAVVALAETLNVRGNAVLLDHGRGIYSGYWHLSELNVTAGQTVAVGDILGLVGTTGLSTGPHLHWEMRIYGVAVDPLQFLEEVLLVAP